MSREPHPTSGSQYIKSKFVSYTLFLLPPAGNRWPWEPKWRQRHRKKAWQGSTRQSCTSGLSLLCERQCISSLYLSHYPFCIHLFQHFGLLTLNNTTFNMLILTKFSNISWRILNVQLINLGLGSACLLFFLYICSWQRANS